MNEYMRMADRMYDLENQMKQLEKENKVLAQNLEDTEILNKTYEKRFSKLEQENTELKEKLEITDLALDNCLKDSEVEK